MFRLASCLLLLAGITALLLEQPARADKESDKGFVTIFDGKSLKGWKISAKTGHSAASKHKSGGRWVVEDGAIVGTQDIKGNGGIVLTEKEYGNFEVVLEMKNDFGPDSGLFLRSNDRGQAYQAMIDYHEGGNLMGVYGEGIGGFHFRNFTFGKKVTQITPNKSDVPLPISPEKWPEFWKHGEWNELRARITNNPPSVTTWIKGVKFMEFKDEKKRLPDRGSIALQVHGGGDYTKEFVRYRNIRVKELD
ncbi:MAG: DUF1080 domain-containing protein [Gemmataceae bacterium]